MIETGSFDGLQEDIDRPYLLRKIHTYLMAETTALKADLLYRIGTNAEVLTFDDVVLSDSNSGYLNQEQRQRVIAFVKQEFDIELQNWIEPILASNQKL